MLLSDNSQANNVSSPELFTVTRLLAIANKFFSVSWIIFFILLVFLCVLLPRFDFYLEDVQTFLFPLFLLALRKLPRNTRFRLPLGLVVTALLFWLVGALNVRAFSSSVSNNSLVYLSRLEADKDGLLGRDLYLRYNEIAKTYSLPRMALVQRSFSHDEEAESWLEKRSSAIFLVHGLAEWLRVIVPDRSSYFDEPGFIFKQTNTEELAKEAKDYSINLSKNSLVVQPDFFPVPLVFSTHPGLINLPGATPELGRHFLAWMARAIGPHIDKDEGLGEVFLVDANGFRRNDGDSVARGREDVDAIRKHFLYNAISIDGPWKTLAPRSAALFYLGLLESKDISDGQYYSAAALKCALAAFKNAASFVEKRFNADIYAAIFNNAAVLQIIAAENARDIARARQWLTKAAMLPETGVSNHASKLAMLNLLMLDRAGL